jgi:hypothetical protein
MTSAYLTGADIIKSGGTNKKEALNRDTGNEWFH